MKNYTLSFLILVSIIYSSLNHAADLTCKDLKTCAAWASEQTSVKYDLGTLEKRSLKFDKNFLLLEGDPDFLFNFLLTSNDLARIKRDGGIFQIVQNWELKNYQFPIVKMEEIPNSLDFYTVEFTFSSKNKVKNAMLVFKKYLSKEGRLLEVADSPKILVTEIGIQLQALRSIAIEINK